MKQMLWVALAATAALCLGCKQEPGGMSEEEKNQYLTVQKVDLSGAEYLAIAEQGASKSDNTLPSVFKIDKDGKMTAVVFHMVYRKGEDGKPISEEVRSDIRIVPQDIVSYFGVYTLFWGCHGRDQNDNYVDIPSCAFILVRNIDGMAFTFPAFVVPNMPNPNITQQEWENNNKMGVPPGVAYLENEDLYVGKSPESEYSGLFGGYVSKLEIREGEATTKDLVPTKMLDRNSSFILTDQLGVLFVGGGDEYVKDIFKTNTNVFYPNGGFEPLPLQDNQTIFSVGKTVKRLTRTLTPSDAVDYKIDAYRFAPAPPTTTVLERSTQVSGYYTTRNILRVVPCKNHYVVILGEWSGVVGSWLNPRPVRLLVCNYNDDKIQVIDPQAPPTGEWIGNMLCNLGSNAIEFFDFETMSPSQVSYDRSKLDGILPAQWKYQPDPARFVMSSYRMADAKPVTVEIVAATGAVTLKEFPDERKITKLIKLN